MDTCQLLCSYMFLRILFTTTCLYILFIIYSLHISPFQDLVIHICIWWFYPLFSHLIKIGTAQHHPHLTTLVRLSWGLQCHQIPSLSVPTSSKRGIMRTSEMFFCKKSCWSSALPIIPSIVPLIFNLGLFHLGWGLVYPLFVLETQAMSEYVQEKLQKGLIRMSNAPAGTVFITEKRDGMLWPCIDYRVPTTLDLWTFW